MATLTAIKKAIDPQVATDVKRMAKMFKHICANNPEAVKAAFGAFLSQKTPEEKDRMIEFYKDMAEYLETTFDYS